MTGHVIAFPQKHSTSRTPVGLGLSENEFQAICRLCCQLSSGWLIERIEDPLDGVRAMLLKVSREGVDLRLWLRDQSRGRIPPSRTA
jgi:hypothetical protein